MGRYYTLGSITNHLLIDYINPDPELVTDRKRKTL
jgi:hypothetical protein